MNKLKDFLLDNPVERLITTYAIIFVTTSLGWVEWEYWALPIFIPLAIYGIVELIRPNDIFRELDK